MPIKGITDAESSRRSWDKLGSIRKGRRLADGTMEDLEYFRFVPKETPYKDELLRIWAAAYGEKPVNIEIFLPKDTVEENWSTWMEAWGKTGLKFRCNGHHWVQWQNADLTYTRDYECLQQKVCPYCSGEKPRTKEDPGDDQVGYLEAMLIPFISAGYTGTVIVNTTSINDLVNINSTLYATWDEASRHGKTLRGIPFNLMRVKETIQTRYKAKSGEFVRKPDEKFMVHLMPNPEWARAAIVASRQVAFGALEESEQRPMLIKEEDDEDPTPAIQVVGEPVFDDIPPEEPEAPPEGSVSRPSAPRNVLTPEKVMGILREHIERRRAEKFNYKDEDERGKAEWKIVNTLKGVVGNEADMHLVLQFLVDGSDFNTMDDAEVETLRKYMAVSKIDGVWELAPAVQQEIRDVLEHQHKATGQVALIDPPFFDDWHKMGIAAKRKYATKLFNRAKKSGIQTMTYTDETLDAWITATEEALKDVGVGENP